MKSTKRLSGTFIPVFIMFTLIPTSKGTARTEEVQFDNPVKANLLDLNR
jgi:hypothetical protein